MRARVSFGVVAVLAMFGCSSAASTDAATWQTAVDTLGDTIVVRTTGAESPPRHAMHVEMSIGQLEGPDEYTFGSITDVVVSPDGDIYVFDSQAMQLRRYDAEGRFVRAVGRKGAGPGEYDRVNGVDVGPDGRVFLWDAGNARLATYTAHGEPEGSFRIQGGFFTSDGLLVDSTGRFYTRGHIFGDDISEWRSIIVRYGVGGTPVDTFEVPKFDIPSSVIFASRDGSRSSNNVPFSPTALWALTPDMQFISGRSDVYAIHRELPGGERLRIERVATPVPVSDAERSEREERATWSMRRTDPSWRWNGPPIPEVKPYFKKLATGLDGRIWVQLSQPGEVDPEADSAARATEVASASGAAGGPPPDRPPALRYREPQVWDVFERDGRYLGQIELPHDFTLHAMRGEHVWGVLRDELDVQSVVRARIEPPLASTPSLALPAP